ncbi:MAG: long-chain fatty acid--CoA ligase [Chloroflexi bacterium]|nr:MAG: long-chain fatty acid--CoA ligase [Chloroflexota bacterium]
MYIGDWLGKRELLTPDRLALVADATGSRYTYRQLNERANRLANALRHTFGIRKGDRVAVLAKNCVEYLDALFATGKLGAILVPLNWRLSVEELAYQLNDCTACVLLVGPEFAATGHALRAQTPVAALIAFGDPRVDGAPQYDDLLAHATDEPVTEEIELDDPHIILYTSGTTGRPKGAVLPHRVLVWNSLNTNVGWELRADDVSVIHTPLFHTGGINVLTIPLLHAGGTLVLMREWDPQRCLQLIERERVTVFFAVPTMFQQLLSMPNFVQTDFSSVRFFISGGAPCPVPLIEAYQARGIPFRQGYGLTEVSVNCFTLNPEDAIRKVGSVGRPIFHLDARVVDPVGQDVGPGEIGELWLRGPIVCAGYWNNLEATREAISDGWFHTGDLARLDDEGYYYIVDRKKDMFISGGENVYPAEVERTLYEHPAVLECAVIGVPDERWGEVGCAVIVVRVGTMLTPGEVVHHCQQQLARYKVPKHVLFVDELPRNSGGKVLKPLLRNQFSTQVR